MICKACNKVPDPTENEDCFEKALDVLKKHYTYYKNTLQHRELELHQVKERNEKLNKALQLLQKNLNPAKRFKSQPSDQSWLGSNSSQEDQVAPDLSLVDDEPIGASNLNVALNSEQLFDISALSQCKNSSTTSSSEMVHSPWVKESPKRNKQRDTIRYLKDRNSKNLGRSKSEWHTKERNITAEKCWAMKFLQPTKTKASEKKIGVEAKKAVEKKLCLSLKKANPSKMKQSLIHFNKSKDTTFPESDIGEDIIEASPAIVTKNSKVGRSWTHRSGHNYNSSDNNITNETIQKDNTTKSLDDIVFDFSPSKKADLSQNENSSKNMEPKKLKFASDISTDCTSVPNDDNLEISTNKSDSASVLILTPTSQDIIFLDDTCNIEPEIDTMDLLGDIMKPDSTDNLEKLKKYESKCIQKQQQSKNIDLFKKPPNMPQNNAINAIPKFKQEKTTQDNMLKQNQVQELEEEKPSCSKSRSNMKTSKHQNPLLSSDEQDTEDDEDFMPKPFVVKQESESIKTLKKLSIKQRFNIDCEDCEKLITFLDERLTDAQIQQHLDKCKCHNNHNMIMRQNTPKDFWNPFILSFQADDPRNEVLIDNRFMDNKK